MAVLNREHGDHVQTGAVYVEKTWQPPNEKESLKTGKGMGKERRRGNEEGGRRGGA